MRPNSARAHLPKALRSGLLAGILVVVACAVACGQTTHILFVGNSFTHGEFAPVLNYNAARVTDENYGLLSDNPRHENNPNGSGPWGGVPGIFKKLADQAGQDYEVHLETISGTTLEYHYANALSVIQQSKWDKVVLQEHSTRPLPAARGGQPSAFVDYATRLERAVHTANPAARVYLFQTWARADLTYPSGKPYSGLPIDTMTQNLHDAYYRCAGRNANITAVAPVGDAWLRAIQADVARRNPYLPATSPLNLWAVDYYHPSAWGAYLAACVLLGQITGVDPRTLGDREQAAKALGIAPREAIALQQIAFQQVQAGIGPLPVTLTAFAARRQSAGVVVDWATASEERNARFDVQRSLDGTTFSTVATVPGRGTTAQPTSYTAFDHQAPLGVLYYRLRQVDFDGQTTFSAVSVVASAAATGPVLFPNPAREVLFIAAPSATAYRLRNQLGQLLLQGPMLGGTAELKLQTLPAGVYLVELETSTGLIFRRVVHE